VRVETLFQATGARHQTPDFGTPVAVRVVDRTGVGSKVELVVVVLGMLEVGAIIPLSGKFVAAKELAVDRFHYPFPDRESGIRDLIDVRLSAACAWQDSGEIALPTCGRLTRGCAREPP
jgi:hypothetical protein